MINLILFGPPGAGKGTQSAKLIEKYSLTHIATGDLFRKHLKEGTPLGKLAQDYMTAGVMDRAENLFGELVEALDGTDVVLGGGDADAAVAGFFHAEGNGCRGGSMI